MAQPYDRVYNFSAGPCTLPVEVLEEARDEIMNYRGAGMSVMEMSHRSKPFEGILAETKENLSKLLNIPSNYKVLFLQGGASLQFSIVPISYLCQGGSADYVITGTWGKKALESARIEGPANVVWDGKPENYNDVPDLGGLTFDSKASYIHYTSNETIQGVQFKRQWDLSNPVVCDMSSDILSKPFDVSKYAMIYAGAQKNMGPAGTTLVIIRDDFIDRVPENMHPMLDYKLQAENDSLYNTPPCWGIYMCGLVYKWLLRTGGLEARQKLNQDKASLVYRAIDESGGFYKGHAKQDARSDMNVTFTLSNDELTDTFVKEAEKEKLDGLKGHRSVGGIRASIYNAFPKEGCEVLAQFMSDFAKRNG